MAVHHRCFPRLGALRSRYAEGIAPMEERRRHPRKACAIVVDYSINDHVYKNYIQNISAGGVLINARGPFLSGQEISMSFLLPHSQKYVRSTGKIAWIGQQEMGVRFKDIEPKGSELNFYGVESDQVKAMNFKKKLGRIGRVNKKRVRWQPSKSPDVLKHRLYWARSGEVNYNSDCVELGDVTEVILPDDIPSFPLIAGDIELGVTAIDQAGNESDITKLNVFINFRVPEAPQNLEVEDM